MGPPQMSVASGFATPPPETPLPAPLPPAKPPVGGCPKGSTMTAAGCFKNVASIDRYIPQDEPEPPPETLPPPPETSVATGGGTGGQRPPPLQPPPKPFQGPCGPGETWTPAGCRPDVATVQPPPPPPRQTLPPPPGTSVATGATGGYQPPLPPPKPPPEPFQGPCPPGTTQTPSGCLPNVASQDRYVAKGGVSPGVVSTALQTGAGAAAGITVLGNTMSVMGDMRRTHNAYHVMNLSGSHMGHRVPLAARHPGAPLETIPLLGVKGPGSRPVLGGIGLGPEPTIIVERTLGQS